MIVLGISGLLTDAAPFGTGAMSVTQRMVYYSIVVLSGLVVLRAVVAVVARRWPELDGWKQSGAVAAITAVTFSPLLWIIAHGMTAHLRPSIAPFWVMLVLVFVATAALLSLRTVLGFETSATRPRLLERLGNDEDLRVLHVASCDHYVEVRTDRGIERLLMRLGDAIAELDGVTGMQVHRSHWVAAEAVRSVAHEGGRMFLVLEDGERVPVSRAYRDRVASAFA